MSRAKENGGNVIALFGSASQVGRHLLPRLAHSPRWKRILCFDNLGPRRSFAHSSFYRVDLTEPALFHTLLQVFEKEKVDTVVHTAFINEPITDPEYIHDYESIGTLQILAACAEMGIGKLVVQGTTLAYGARPKNPMYLSEEHKLSANPTYEYMNEKIDVERQVADFGKAHPEVTVSMLRLAMLMGRDADNFMWHYLRRAAVPVVLGFDPLWQVLHMEDALALFETALDTDLPGVYNYAAPGVLPLSTLIRFLGGRRLPIPYSLLKNQIKALRLLQLASFPPQHLEYFRFGCVADCTRAFKVKGVRPKYDIQQTLVLATEEQNWD